MQKIFNFFPLSIYKSTISIPQAEKDNMMKWIKKWGRMSGYDSDTFVIPVKDTGVDPVMNFKENIDFFEEKLIPQK